MVLAKDSEKEALDLVAGECKPGTATKDKRALPSCTGEGRNYVVECLPCRRKGIQKMYFGETSRSGYQRAGEHKKEIDNGVATHPLVIHFCEEHQGRKQEVIFRVLSSHLTALERQTVESINILAAGRDLGDILNNKSE